MFALTIERRGGDPEGAITIGEHVETFPADLSIWDLRQYQASWGRSAAHVLEHGYGRFLTSVTAPGRGPYTTWVCRTRGEQARLFKSILLPSLSGVFAGPQDAEIMEDDYAERNEEEPSLNVYRCTLADIARFEARLLGRAGS